MQHVASRASADVPNNMRTTFRLIAEADDDVIRFEPLIQDSSMFGHLHNKRKRSAAQEILRHMLDWAMPRFERISIAIEVHRKHGSLPTTRIRCATIDEAIAAITFDHSTEFVFKP